MIIVTNIIDWKSHLEISLERIFMTGTKDDLGEN